MAVCNTMGITVEMMCVCVWFVCTPQFKKLLCMCVCVCLVGGPTLMMSNPGPWWLIIAACQYTSEDDAFRCLSSLPIQPSETHWQPLLLHSALWGCLICTNCVLWFLLQPDIRLHQPIIDYHCPQRCFFNAAWWCLMADNRTSCWPSLLLMLSHGALVTLQINKLSTEAVHIVLMDM